MHYTPNPALKHTISEFERRTPNHGAHILAIDTNLIVHNENFIQGEMN